jgi:Holliday junction resolvase-like predicted endonuclease
MNILIGILLTTILLLIGAIVLLSKKAGRASKRRNRRAHDGEKSAISLLQSKGYRIIGKQVKEKSGMYIDGILHEVEVRVDFIVKKNLKKYIVEVKTGKNAPDPTTPSTRRQLLEYSLIFKGYGVLLVDMEEKRIKKIHF